MSAHRVFGAALRIGIAVGPTTSAVWATRDAATGELRGATVDLGAAIAKALGLPAVYVEHASSGKIIEAAANDSWDAAFAPVDAERKAFVDFGPDYFLSDSTYMVAAASNILDVEDVDRPTTRIVGVDNTATLRAARRSLRHASVIAVTGMEEAAARFAAGEAEAIALGRETLVKLREKFLDARILKGHFLATGVAVATPLGHRDALRDVGTVMESFKHNGTLRRIFDANGLAHAPVAPPGSQS